jgi:hypothetical protein
MANPTNPLTGKRYTGRVSDDRIKRDYAEYERIYGEPYSDGNTGNGNGSSRSDPDPDTTRKARRFTLGQETVNVETPTELPNTKPATSERREKKTGAITPQHVETWMVQGFALMAMMRNADYWAIERPDIEVRPWAGSAAELLNKIPQDKAEKLTEVNAALAVSFGMFTLVSMRVQMDRTMRMERAREQREQYIEEEGISEMPDSPERSGLNGRATHKPGTGAAPVAPNKPIFGNPSGPF